MTLTEAQGSTKPPSPFPIFWDPGPSVRTVKTYLKISAQYWNLAAAGHCNSLI